MAQTPPHINSLFPSQYIVHFWLSLIGKIISFPQKHVFPAYKKNDNHIRKNTLNK